MPLDPGRKFTILSMTSTGAMAEMANKKVESYPGAKLSHADRIASNYSHTQQPEKIILYFGLNNRSTEPKAHPFKTWGNYLVQQRKHSPNRRYTFHLSTFHQIVHKEKSEISRSWTTWQKMIPPSHDHSVSRFITFWNYIWFSSLDKTNGQ